MTGFDGTGLLIARGAHSIALSCVWVARPFVVAALFFIAFVVAFIFVSLFSFRFFLSLLLCFLSRSVSLLALSSISRMRKESVSSSENKSKREWETFSVVFLGFHSLASRFNLSLSSPSHSLLLVRAWFALAECVCVSL